MIYIRKGSASADVSREINRVKRDCGWDKKQEKDRETARNAFDQLDKSIIRRQLIPEQKGLCAYCMRRIEGDSALPIEHWTPISADARKALEYSNMMLCCDGGQKTAEPETEKVLSCDAAKGDKTITISPYNKEHMRKIKYNREGYISVYPEDAKLQDDIDYILKLNGEIDSSGKMISDTSSALVYSRRQVYQNYVTFITLLGKKGRVTAGAIRKKIDEISNAEEYIEFAGVWLYFLHRKLRQLEGV